MLAFFIVVVSLSFFAFFIWYEHKKDLKHEQEIFNFIYKNPPKPFSVSEYYDRIEKESIKIMSSKGSKDDYKITLWIGLDGLQLNEDGSTEWIKRGETEKPVHEFQQSSSYISGTQNVSPTCIQNDIQNACQSQIDSLQAQNQALRFQPIQNSQTQNMINAMQNCVQPPYLQFYPSFYYPTPLTSYCCNSTQLYW